MNTAVLYCSKKNEITDMYNNYPMLEEDKQ